MSSRNFHRPIKRANLDDYSSTPDAQTRTSLAHELARQLIPPVPTAMDSPEMREEPRGREETARFVALAEQYGLAAIAELWANAPAVSLPGSLWRLYALRSWIRSHPKQATRWFRQGQSGSPAEAVAGIADPPTPADIATLADHILRGAFHGHYAAALERAAAFVLVAARGRAQDDPTTGTETGVEASTAGLAAFARMADDLLATAQEYRRGRLDG